MRKLHAIAVLVVTAIAATTGARSTSAQTIVNADRAEITQKIVVGSSTFGDVLRIVGSPAITVGAGTINPMVIDADGDVLEDTSTTATAAGAWTWGARGTFSNGLTIGNTLTGSANPGTGVILDIDTTTRVATIQPQLRLYETDQLANQRYWFLRGQDSQIFMEAWDDGITTRSTLWRGYKRASADEFGAAGTADTFELGANVRNFRPETSSFSKLGDFNRRWLSLDVDTLRAQVFVVNETQAFTNGALLVSRGSNLTRDLSDSATVIHVEHKGFRYFDFVVMRALSTTSGTPQAEWMRLITGSYDCTEGDTDKTAGSIGANPPLHANCNGIDNNDYAYSVQRDQAGSGAFAWAKGSAVPSTDRYLDIYSFNDALITFGGAVIGDKAVGYWNFDDAPATTFNAARSGGGDAALGTGAGNCGGSFWPGTVGPGGCGSWFRPTGAGNGDITQAITLADLNLSQPGQNQDAAFSCHGTLEAVVYVTPAANAAGTFVNLFSKWDGTNISTATFVARHYGAASGADAGAIDLIGYRNGAQSNLAPRISVVAGGWYHIVWTWGNHNGGHVYLNGVRNGSIAPTTFCSVNNDHPIRVAGFTGPSGSGSAVAELAVYAYDLSEEQVKAHWRALQTDRAGLHSGPTIAGYERQSDTNWYGVSPRWACGNLVGFYDYRRQTYGCSFGDYTGDWTAIDDKGWRVMYQNTVKMQAAGGNLSLTGDLTIGNLGSIRSGATDFSTGTGYWLDCNWNGSSCNPRFRIGVPGGRRVEWSSGSLKVVSDGVRLDENGIMLSNNTSGSPTSSTSVQWQGSFFVSTMGLVNGNELRLHHGGNDLLIGGQPGSSHGGTLSFGASVSGGNAQPYSYLRHVYSGTPCLPCGASDGLQFHAGGGDHGGWYSFKPSQDNAFYLGSPSFRWKDIYFAEPVTNTTGVFPLVTVSGRIMAKNTGLHTNGNGTLLTCPAGQAIKSIDIEYGLVIAANCGTP